jgi:hypothetical protein
MPICVFYLDFCNSRYVIVEFLNVISFGQLQLDASGILCRGTRGTLRLSARLQVRDDGVATEAALFLALRGEI